MKKELIAMALVCLLVLFIVGCKTPVEEPTAGEETGEQISEKPSLTGDITEVDNLDSDISDEELEDIDSSLDEITW